MWGGGEVGRWGGGLMLCVGVVVHGGEWAVRSCGGVWACWVYCTAGIEVAAPRNTTGNPLSAIVAGRKSKPHFSMCG